MKLTTSKLKQIIKEELKTILQENIAPQITTVMRTYRRNRAGRGNWVGLRDGTTIAGENLSFSRRVAPGKYTGADITNWPDGAVVFIIYKGKAYEYDNKSPAGRTVALPHPQSRKWTAEKGDMDDAMSATIDNIDALRKITGQKTK